MELKTFTPHRQSHPHSIIIMPSSFGSSLASAAGDRAQEVADQMGMTVIALERPTSLKYLLLPWLHHRLARSQYGQQFRKLGKRIAAQLDPEITQIIVAGHSAGALDAILLVQYGGLPVTHVSVSDPPGLRKLTIFRGQYRYIRYLRKYERSRLPDDAAMITNPYREPSSRFKSFRHSAGEILLYSRAWASNAGLLGLEDLCAKPDIAIAIHFAQFSFNGTPSEQAKTAKILQEIRDTVPEPKATSDIAVIANSRHSTFNSSHYRAGAISTLLARSGDASIAQTAKRRSRRGSHLTKP